MRAFRYALLIVLPLAACSHASSSERAVEGDRTINQAGALPTGRTLDPTGAQRVINPLTLDVVPAPGRRTLLMQSGYDVQGFQVIDSLGAVTQTVEQKAAFLGAAFAPDSSHLYVSGGDLDLVYDYAWANGRAELRDSLVLAVRKSPRDHGTRYPAGVATSADGRFLYVAENLGDSMAVFDLRSRALVQRVATGRYPYALQRLPDGRIAVSIWSRDWLEVFTPTASGVAPRAERWATGRHPSSLKLSPTGTRLYAVSGSTNRVVVHDTRNGVRVGELQDPPPAGPDEGATPTNVAFDASGTIALVTEGDANAVAVFALSPATSGVATASGTDALIGRIPVGWYPAGARVMGSNLLVANAKGMGTRNNAADGPGPRNATMHTGTPSRAGYTLAQIGGSLSVIPLPTFTAAALAPFTARVVRSNRWNAPRDSTFAYPPIKHVIYVIKENRTYDQMFGDLAQADGDTTLLFFDRSVSPNHHALAERFGIYDRFLVNAEVSPDGHNWSTAAYTSDYLQRTVPSNYGGKGRSYDYEGTNRGRVLDGEDEDVNAPTMGYLWDLAARAKISFRNYGEFVVGEDLDRDKLPQSYRGVKPFLKAHTHPTFPGFNTNILDQRRADLWIEELQRFAAADSFPQLSIVRLPNDHTAGASAGALTPKALVADNDLALGRMVEALSKTRFWSSTAIFVVEDDAQNGPDHVDSHRAPFLLISPWAKPGVVHRFVNTTDAIRTIEDLLHLGTLSQFDHFGRPLREVWRSTPDTSRYVAITPSQSLAERNPARGRAGALSRTLDFDLEDVADEATFNQVLWLALKGDRVPMPAPRRMSQLELIRAR
jgi:DNA-binding beta-propeller fold protein YncE